MKRLIVLAAQLEVSFGMCANRANLGSFLAEVDVTAVAADPSLFGAVFAEDFTFFDIFAQSSVALLVLFFDLAYGLEQEGNVVKAFFFCFLREGSVHIGPLVVFTSGSILQVVQGGAYAVVQQLEPDFCMLFFVVGSLGEDSSDLLKAFLLCFGSVVGVFVA